MLVDLVIGEGSICISEAFFRYAVMRIWSTNFTTLPEVSSYLILLLNFFLFLFKGDIRHQVELFKCCLTRTGFIGPPLLSKNFLIKASISSLMDTEKWIFFDFTRALIWSVLLRSLGSSISISTPSFPQLMGTHRLAQEEGFLQTAYKFYGCRNFGIITSEFAAIVK